MAFDKSWYTIKEIEQIDTPALVIYKNRVIDNLQKMINLVGNPDRLMPHVKTHKMIDIVRLQLSLGIRNFKCATIAEAEMIAIAGGKTVLIAIQPVGPKLQRIASLVKKYPETLFSVIADNIYLLEELEKTMESSGIRLGIYIDLNIGMNRTGILPEKAMELIDLCSTFKFLEFKGFHVYDGHNVLTDFQKRREQCLKEYEPVHLLLDSVEKKLSRKFELICGGTPTFPIHALNERTICSPGTTVLWDAASAERFPDMDFKYAAAVITRVVSIIGENLICLDLGHKAVAAETPLPRVRFINHPEVVPVSQSEEHLVANVPDSRLFKTGDVLYGIPWHICPTCALYQGAVVVEDNRWTDDWEVTARNRFLTV